MYIVDDNLFVGRDDGDRSHHTVEPVCMTENLVHRIYHRTAENKAASARNLIILNVFFHYAAQYGANPVAFFWQQYILELVHYKDEVCPLVLAYLERQGKDGLDVIVVKLPVSRQNYVLFFIGPAVKYPVRTLEVPGNQVFILSGRYGYSTKHGAAVTGQEGLPVADVHKVELAYRKLEALDADTHQGLLNHGRLSAFWRSIHGHVFSLLQKITQD